MYGRCSSTFIERYKTKRFGRFHYGQKSQNDEDDDKGRNGLGYLKPIQHTAQAANVFRVLVLLVRRMLRVGRELLEKDAAGTMVKLIRTNKNSQAQHYAEQQGKNLPALECGVRVHHSNLLYFSG
jgi:hypothetical protein